MNKNLAQTIHFPLLNATTFVPETTGTPVVYLAKDGTVALATNSVAYDSNNLWSLALTAAETNVDILAISVTLTGAVTFSELIFTKLNPAPVSQVPVPPNRTAVLKGTLTGLAATVPETMRVGDEKLIAVSFANDIPVNGWFQSITSVTLDSGATGGITFVEANAAADHEDIKVLITAVTAGTYVVAVKAVYAPNGEIATGYATIVVAGA